MEVNFLSNAPFAYEISVKFLSCNTVLDSQTQLTVLYLTIILHAVHFESSFNTGG